MHAAKLSTFIEHAKPEQIAELINEQRELQNEWLRRQIVENNRIDILATEVLGYTVFPHHLAMMRYQFLHPDNLQLVFRGAGKTTTCTVSKVIHLLIKNRNLRIMLASKTKGNAEGFLKEIKAHLENNARLTELFGPFYDPHKTTKWTDAEIEVLGRTVVTKEASVTCSGVDSAVVSRHYDVIIADDLVDEDNARTAKGREKTRTWYYQTLDPTLEPPDPNVPHRGEFHRLGTHYHWDDLYAHLKRNELKHATQVIPALDAKGRSCWPEKYPAAWFQKKKRKSGTIIFNAQYQCNTEAMKGEIFRYDDCQLIEDAELPKDMKIFMGVDLAIKQPKPGEKADGFSIAVVGITGKLNTDDIYVYVLDAYWAHARFAKQTTKIVDFYKRHSPIAGGVESNAYQEAQLQTLKARYPTIRLHPVYTVKDKVARAWKLSALFEAKRVFFRRGMGAFVDQLVLFPNKPADFFDALDIAIAARKKRRKRTEARREFGVI